MSGIRKIVTINDIKELKLDQKTLQEVTNRDFPVRGIICAARDDCLEMLPGIGPAAAKRIFDAVDAAGFIFHESEQSQAVRCLLSTAFHYQVATIAEYEAQREFSESQISALQAFLSDNFAERDQTVLKLRFGLDGQPPLRQSDVGQQLGVSGERVRQILERALRRMRHYSRAAVLAEIFPEFPGIPEAAKTACDPIHKADLANKPLEFLDLSIRTHNSLIRSGIKTVGELLEATPQDLMRVRNFGKRDLDRVQEVLFKFGLRLKD